MISGVFTGVKGWLIGGTIVAFVALGSAVWIQTARLGTAHANLAKAEEANRTLKKTIEDERALRDTANRLAKEARERAEEARREADKLKRENAKRPARNLSPGGGRLYDRLQRGYQRNQDKAPSK